MEKLVRLTYTLLIVWGLSLLSLQSAQATHIQGGQLTYVALGNNQYKVTLLLFRDCAGSALATTYNLNIRRGDCTAPLALSVATTQAGGLITGSPYCASSPGGTSPCGPTLPTNYQQARYEWVVTLSPAPLWTMSVTSDGARPYQANIDGSSYYLYLEATLSNQVGGTVLQNSSPQFDANSVPIPFVCWKQQNTLNFTATDADGDELVYDFEQPYQGCNSVIPYLSYSTTGSINVGSATAPCTAQVAGTTNYNYSKDFPISSFTLSGTCPTQTATPYFLFNSSNGSFTFRPATYDATNLANNKYTVVGKVSEYRVINGVRTLIGMVRRSLLVIVIDCGTNVVPSPPTASNGNANSGSGVTNSADSTSIRASTCNYTRIRVNFSDPNATDVLTVSYPTLDPQYLPIDVARFQIVGNGTTHPVGIFDIQPDISYAGRTFRIPVQIRDNGCPVNGQQTRVIVLTLSSRNVGSIAASAAGTSVCAGGPVTLTATAARPDSAITVQNPVTLGKATYTYRWDAANGLAAADQNKQNPTVRPTQTTRYVVHIIANDFRLTPTPTCVDTTSIVVRVVPSPTVTATASLTQVCTGATVTLSASAVRPTGNPLPDTYTYTWTGPGVPANATGATLTVTPTTAGVNTYTVTATGLAQYGCSATNTVQVRVVPPPTVVATTTTSVVCPGATATLTAVATPPTGVTDTYTYAWSGTGVPANTRGATLTVMPTATTTYTVTATGSGQTGCAATATVTVQVVPSVVADFTVTDSVGTNGQRTSRPPVFFTFTNRTSAPSGTTVTYTWTYQRVRNLDGSAAADPVTPFVPTQPLQLNTAGYYRIRLTASVVASGASCPSSVKEHTIVVPDLQTPNIITPNGDGLNDRFIVSSTGTTGKLEVFSRWGRKVYEQDNYANNWGGDNLAAGTYYYLLTDRSGVQTKGFLEIVR